MTDTPDLRDQIAQAIARYDWGHGLSANGEPGWQARGEAGEVLAVVAPLLAAKDQETERVGENFARAAGRASRLAAELDEARACADLASAQAEAIARDRDSVCADNDELRAEVDKLRADLADEQAAHRETNALYRSADAKVQELRTALAGHLFDGESLSTREAIRSELIKQGAEAAREVERLRAELAEEKWVTTGLREQVARLISERDEALEVAERAARDTGQRTPLANVEADLAGLAAPEATTSLPCCAHPAIVHSGEQCSYPECPCGKPVAEADRCEAAAKPKPRRDERIDQNGLYAEPRDPGGA